MGFDIRVGRRGRSLHCPYGWFAQFRRRIARHIGIDLETTRGYGGRRSWSKLDDPLDHSDWEDGLTAEQCRVVGPRLREIAAAIGDPEDDEDPSSGSSWLR